MSDNTVGNFHQRMHSTDKFGRPQNPFPGDRMFRVGYWGLTLMVGGLWGALLIAGIHDFVIYLMQ